MRTWWIAGLVVGLIAGSAVSGAAASWSGAYYAQGKIHPEAGVGGGGEMTLAGMGWAVTETSVFDVWPTPTDSEWLQIAFESQALTFAATAAFSFVPLSYGSLDLALTGDLGSFDIPAENPLVDVSSSITAGVTLDAGLSPYASFDATTSIGSHYLLSSTVLYAQPANVESLIDAYVSIFQTTLGEGDGRIGVSLSAYGETYIVPLEFSYIYLRSKISVGDIAVSGYVTYSGGGTFALKLRLGMSFGPIELGKPADSVG